MLEIGIVEMIFGPLEVPCISNEVWEIGGNEIRSVHFHAGYRTLESSVVF